MEQCIVQLHEQEGVNLFVGDGVCNRLARAHECAITSALYFFSITAPLCSGESPFV